jgi:hypothetical protein
MSPCRTPQLFRALSVVPLVRKNTTGQLHHHFIRRGAVALVDHPYDPCADVQRERATVRCHCAFAFSGFCFNFGGFPFTFHYLWFQLSDESAFSSCLHGAHLACWGKLGSVTMKQSYFCLELL